MTREEAVETLENHTQYFVPVQDLGALNMAIAALRPVSREQLDFLKEIGMYCVDEHGNPVDAYNHAMDELRYSINHFVKQYMY